jgi:hypothetical protein
MKTSFLGSAGLIILKVYQLHNDYFIQYFKKEISLMMNAEKKGVQLKETDGKGEGIFATKLFQPSETVLTGVIAKTVNRNHSHASQIGENEFVVHDGLISKVNHSCEPNCGIRLNNTGAHDFIAIKKIHPNDEITFDYAMRNYSIDYFPDKCICGSEKCRIRVTGWKDLTDSKKKEYSGIAAPYLLELDAKILHRRKVAKAEREREME